MFERPVAFAPLLFQLRDPEPGSRSAAVMGLLPNYPPAARAAVSPRSELTCKPRPRRADTSPPASSVWPPVSAKSPPPSNYPILDETTHFSRPPRALYIVPSLCAWLNSTSALLLFVLPCESPGVTARSLQAEAPSHGLPLSGKGVVVP